MIKDLKEDQEVHLVAIVTSIDERTTKTGQSFLRLTLSDKTGSITSNIWDSKIEDLEKNNVGEGSFVYCLGRVGSFKGIKQFTVNTDPSIHMINIKDYDNLKSKYDIEDYIPSAPISGEEIKRFLLETIDEIEDPEIRDFVKDIFDDYGDDLVSFPGSVGVHHHYLNGLGYHIYRMLRSALALSTVYTEGVNYDYLLAGIILHDIGKIKCYELGELGLATGYTIENDLMGHIAIGFKMIDKYQLAKEKKDLINHLILSHHGIREYGAVAEPVTIEAQMLHYIDSLDAKLTIVEDEMEKLEPGDISNRIWSLDNNKVYKAKEN